MIERLERGTGTARTGGASTVASRTEARLPQDQVGEGVRATPGAGQQERLREMSRTPTVEVQGRYPSSQWAWIERLHDTRAGYKQQNFLPVQEHRDPDLVRAFGTRTPNSSDVLLHFAGDPPAGAPRRPYPILLIHGATKDGNYWSEPHDGMPGGLAEELRQAGFHVYALTFAHNQDSNFLQQPQVANCLSRIQALEGGRKVVALGHSKGGVPLRMHVSDVHAEGMPGYGNEVRRALLVAHPGAGIDYAFRHPSANVVLCTNDRINAPMSWNRVYYGIFPVDRSDRHIDGTGKDFFPGQREILGRLDRTHPLPFDLWDPAHITYYGGHSLAGDSTGIEHAMDRGGRLIERLQQTPIKVDVALLAGSRADIPNILNEENGASDGLLFVDSARSVPKGTRVVADDVMPLNHKEVTYAPAAVEWIKREAGKP